jgi:site-specific recombinase XerD
MEFNNPSQALAAIGPGVLSSQDSCQIEARTDLDAMRAWLREYESSPATRRSYEKEAQRFLLWCRVEKKKALAELNRQDFEHYFAFLKNPSPREFWCGRPGNKSKLRGTAGWRPFAGPLGPKAMHVALSVLSSFMSYIADAGYIKANPMSLIRRKSRFLGSSKGERGLEVASRILDDDEWAAFLHVVAHLPELDFQERLQKARVKLIVSMLFLLGLRVEELASHQWLAFRELRGKWWFFVAGKGGKFAKIPANDCLMSEVNAFRVLLGKSAQPAPDEMAPIVPAFTHDEALSSRQISKILKSIAHKAAAVFDEPHKKKKLESFSPHWLRHLSASMQDRSGIEFKHIRANHRHERDDTTRLYVHANDAERHKDMDKLIIRFTVAA